MEGVQRAGLCYATGGFNPLEIGSTLQIWSFRRSSPTPPFGGFNPLEIGSTLQMDYMEHVIILTTALVSIP